MRIAILEDDPVVVAHLKATLKAPLFADDECNECVVFESGEQMRRALRSEVFDLMVLDWNVPDLDGYDLLRWLREEKQDHTQVLMLSARMSEKDVACALRRGAGDYVVKPFRPLELRARLARLYERRHRCVATDALNFLGWSFNPEKCEVMYSSPESTQDHELIALSQSEFKLALTLFRNVGRTLSRSYLTEVVGYEGGDGVARTLDSHIYRLRKKLKLNGNRNILLLVVYGRGYRLEASEAGNMLGMTMGAAQVVNKTLY